MPKVVISNWVHDAVIDRLAPHCDVVANPHREPWPMDELARRAADADALIAFMTERIDDAFLARCPGLRIVAAALKGYDNIDVAACTRRGVWLTIVDDLLTAPTAELTVGLMIALARHVTAGDRLVRGGGFAGWRPTLYGGTLDGAVVGLIGAGAVGQVIAQRLAGFDCELRYHDQRRLPAETERQLRLRHMPLPELVRGSDFLVLALPLTSSTQHLVNADLLQKVKPGCYLVNPARGSLVDEEAVADALDAGQLAGYAADTFEMEDWARPDRPAAVAARLRAPDARTVLTPHLGSAVDAVRRDIAMAAADNVLQSLSGERPAGAINDPVMSC